MEIMLNLLLWTGNFIQERVDEKGTVAKKAGDRRKKSGGLLLSRKVIDNFFQ